MHRILSFSLCILFLAATAAHAVPESTSPGKSSVFVKDTNQFQSGAIMVPIAGTISKGKTKRVLRIDATLTLGIFNLGDQATATINVNGVSLGSAVGHCHGASLLECTVTGTFWLDLDAAELADPGSVKGAPLNVTMTGASSNSSDVGEFYTASFSAQMVKK
ncbi:MAG TPA: hypothetical protein VEL28_11260 [Candidatus Binatia bacterium]|nr:hypothetical protein [Candidatus Binatia bacterium]